MNIFLIRHGQSLHNINKTENLDSPITKEGEKQVDVMSKAIKKYLEKDNLVAFCSPYLRTLQTAKIISNNLGFTFLVDEGPREKMININKILIPNRESKYPEFNWISKNKFVYHKETPSQLTNRLKIYIKSLPSDNNVLIVSHGGVIMNLFCLILGAEMHEDFDGPRGGVENASVSWIKNGKVKWFNKIFEQPKGP